MLHQAGSFDGCKCERFLLLPYPRESYDIWKTATRTSTYRNNKLVAFHSAIHHRALDSKYSFSQIGRVTVEIMNLLQQRFVAFRFFISYNQ